MKEFNFNTDNLKIAENIIARYPRKSSAVLPLLDLAQRQMGGWLPFPVIPYVAKLTDMPEVRVYEVASFYTMLHLEPVGQYIIQVCRTTPCYLCGSQDVLNACKSKLGIDVGETTKDGRFTLQEVECLGACKDAPVVQINDDFYEKLDAKSMNQIIDTLMEKDIEWDKEVFYHPTDKAKKQPKTRGKKELIN